VLCHSFHKSALVGIPKFSRDLILVASFLAIVLCLHMGVLYHLTPNHSQPLLSVISVYPSLWLKELYTVSRVHTSLLRVIPAS
jgi:hypothetical protein